MCAEEIISSAILWCQVLVLVNNKFIYLFTLGNVAAKFSEVLQFGTQDG